MTYYERIFEEAIGNYGIVTSAQAKALGVPPIELVKLARRGRLNRIGHGVYKLDKYAPTEDARDAYADALAIVGEGAYLYGPSVLALNGLCATNPSQIYIATPRRVRKRLPVGFHLKINAPCDAICYYDGIACEPISEALRESQGLIMESRLSEAEAKARAIGLMKEGE